MRKRYDTEDGAKVLGINRETFRRLIREGKIEPIRGGPPYFIRGETLKSFIPLLRPMGRPRKITNSSQGEGELKC